MKLGEIVHDSIIENKEKTKSYWEQLMIAANIPTSPPDVKQSNNNNNRSLSSQINLGVMNSPRPADTEPSDGPKIVETVTKNSVPEKNETNVKTTKRSSVIEREIEMQKEREAAFAQEREEALALGVLKVRSRCSNEHDENLNFSIPTTDDGNFSEYGSEEKEDHSLDESRICVPSLEMTAGRSSLHRRTQSMDSMSSGHSSGSIGSAGSGLVAPEPYTRRRLVTVRPIDQPEEENLFVIVRSDKETPIEREIRLSKEREEELRKGKQQPPSSNAFKSRSKSLTCEIISSQPETDSIKPTQQTLPLNRGCLRKLGNQKVFYNITQSKSTSNITDKELDTQKFSPVNNTNTPLNSPISPPNSHPSAKGAVPKLFSRNPNQKGLMKRFIASGGKLNSTFVFSPSRISSPSSSSGPIPLAPAIVHKWNSYVKTDKDTNIVGTRPGYVSAEDKIQVELQEMRKREQELKEQRARSFVRSQPDLLSLLNQEEEEEKHEIRPLKLRSARSNPNLIDMDENTKMPTNERKQPIKRSALIDVWESMIQNVQ